MVAVVLIGRCPRHAHLHLQFFIAKPDAELGKRLRDVFRRGDDSRVPTSCLFFYAQEMLAAVTRT